MFEHEANGSNISRVTRQVLMHETRMCDCYSCIFYLILTKFALKTLLKQQNIPFPSLDFSKQNGASHIFSNNIIMLSQVHNVIALRKVLATNALAKWSVWSQTLSVNNSGLILSTHVQTAHESPDLKMDFRSFDNGLKQLYNVCNSDKHFVNSSLENQHFIWEKNGKSVQTIRTFTMSCLKGY